MLTKKQIRELPIGFTPVLSTGDGRASRYNSSTQSKNPDKFKQEIPANIEKGKVKRVILHETESSRVRRLASLNAISKKQDSIEGLKEKQSELKTDLRKMKTVLKDIMK